MKPSGLSEVWLMMMLPIQPKKKVSKKRAIVLFYIKCLLLLYIRNVCNPITPTIKIYARFVAEIYRNPSYPMLLYTTLSYLSILCMKKLYNNTRNRKGGSGNETFKRKNKYNDRQQSSRKITNKGRA